MSIVKINAITVPEGKGPELEQRFAARQHTVDSQPGFLGFQLLRPTAGEDRYFVVTHWADEESYAAWREGKAKESHSEADKQERQKVATSATLMEFDVALDWAPVNPE